MKDYYCTITVKNNYFLKAMQHNGYKTAAELSRASGVSQSDIGGYLNLKKTPVRKRCRNEYKVSILKLSETLKTLPEDLFPPQHIAKVFKKNKVSAEISIDEVYNLIGSSSPEKLIEIKEMKDQINISLSALKPRDKAILEARYGLNGAAEKTLRECAKDFGVQKERIRQLEARGMRILRNPKVSRNLRGFI